MFNTDNIIRKFEGIIEELTANYKEFDEDYFFTEKEIHAYFYHLCIEDKTLFTINSEYNMVHSEYPTPFKCTLQKKEPYLLIKDNNSKHRRSHIDMVLLNPNFIEWTLTRTGSCEAIKGIKNELFSKYIKEFKYLYSAFCQETNQCILLYALEFKYFRDTFIGTKNPILSIKQDIAKLKTLRQNEWRSEDINYVCKTKLLNFISSKNAKLHNPKDKYLIDNSKEYETIFWGE